MDTLLKDFIDRLESLPDKPSLDTLKTCVLETDGRQLPIKEYTSFSDQGYKRNVVHVSGKCEIAVICFKKEQFTPIHDHGGSIGLQPFIVYRIPISMIWSLLIYIFHR